MKRCDYLIVGGGMAADAAIKGIRSVDANACILMYSKETQAPYKRPVLSKKLWQGKPLEIANLNTVEQNVEMQLGKSIVNLDVSSHTATDSNGELVEFKKLLLATGGTPRTLPFGEGDIIYYRTMDDYLHLREMTETKEHFTIIGGGFIGSEVAASLNSIGKKVTMIMPENHICARLFPEDLAEHVTNYYKNKGVDVFRGELCSGMDKKNGQLILNTQSNKSVVTDGIIAGVGTKPDLSLAQDAGLPVDGGVVTALNLTAGHPDVYAAGDCASFVNPATGMYWRVEHEDNAVTMGKTAGLSMAGEDVKYEYLPMFYSDMFEMGYEAVGQLDSKLDVYADWQEKYVTGVLYYMREGRVRGVLLWNVWDKTDEARGLILSDKTFSKEDLKNRITP